jgi:lipopolysaccharide/colanic/teichoic acid biosynthesis glycosyltransferase
MDAAKRICDLTFALLGLIFLLPLFGLIAIAIKLDSSGAIFFRGKRVGKDGVIFSIYKFRTMIADAAQRGPGITTGDDWRITRVGKFLRRTKLDELPQLLNVVKGEMSLVGPRPEDPAYVARYSPAERRVLSVLPGITSAASLAFRDEERLLQGRDWEVYYLETVMPRKLAIDLEYLARRNLWTDLGIILKTLLALWR